MTTNSNNLLQVLQDGFHITLGATVSLVETVQDPQKRSDSFSEFQTQWQQYAQEWSEKGQTTEQEARRFVEQFMNQQQEQGSSPSSTTTPSPSSGTSQSEIEELTQEITTLRQELEELRQKEA